MNGFFLQNLLPFFQHNQRVKTQGCPLASRRGSAPGECENGEGKYGKMQVIVHVFKVPFGE